MDSNPTPPPDVDLASVELPSGVAPLDADAPLLTLLSVRSNPFLATASREQLLAFAAKLRQITTSPPTLVAAIKSSTPRGPRPTNTKRAERQKLLDSI